MSESAGSSNPSPALRRPPRWWPLWLILAMAGLAIVYVRALWEEPSIQHGHMALARIAVATAVALALWLMFFSRLPWKTRWLTLGIAIGACGLSAAMFEIHGVTGDLVPIIKPRWRRAVLMAATPAAPTAPSLATAPLWPQFLGPHRDSTLPDGPKLARDWTSQPPQKLWRQPIGPAWSGFAVAGGRAVTMEQRGREEMAVCYELLTGKVLWTHADAARFRSTIAGEGPQTTPTIAGARVVTLGGTGILNCLDLATGKAAWSKNIFTDNQSRVGIWGTAGSPLMLGDSVIVNPGGTNGHSLVAYRLGDGGRLWSGGDDNASYSSPCAAALCGVAQMLIFNEHAVFGHDRATGRVLWEFLWNPAHVHVTQPIALDGDRVLVSSGYGEGSRLLQLQRDAAGRFSAKQLWRTRKLKSKFNNMVVRNGHVYGLDDGTLACVELATGALKWRESRYGHGQFILVRDLLLITAENGDVALVEPVPDGRRELARFSAVTGKTWNPPALAGDLLLVRNDEEAACYRLPVAQ
ncbi:MAG: PQQ-binding-like beta-propeller repeat protein [Verrucomicrobia bacterium]|nr:PQQ-binding-like beta-propeller repeat protein [Verrucomicrobiota bacterium]